MTDVREALAARYEAHDDVGRAVTEEANLIPDDEWTSAYEAAYFAKYGVPAEQDQPKTVVMPPDDRARRLGTSAVEGVVNSVWELGRTFRNAADWFVENAPVATAADIEFGNLKPEDLDPAEWSVEDYGPMPDWLDNRTFGEGMVKGVSQFMLPFLAFNKAVGGLQMMQAVGAKTTPWIGRMVSSGAASLPVDFAFIDPIENNLVELAKTYGFESELTDFLEADTTHSEEAATALENRARAAVANMILGIGTDVALEYGGRALTKGGDAAAKAYRLAAEAVRNAKNYQWDTLEQEGLKELAGAVGQYGVLNDVTRAPELVAKEAKAVAKIVAGRIGRLTATARKKFEKSGVLPGMDELADGLIAQGADPAAVRQGIDEGLANHATPDEFTIAAEKREGGRVVASRVKLDDETKSLIARNAPSAKVAAANYARVRDSIARYPEKEGWVAIKPKKIQFDPKTGDIKKITWGAVNEGEGRFTFHLDPAEGKVNHLTEGARKDALAEQMVMEVRDIERRAAAGDRQAIVIQRARGWYTEMRTRLREEFGGAGQVFADLLGSLSPNTAVPQNWDNAIEALRGLVRGEYDEQLAKLEQHLLEGKPMKEFPVEDKITKATGKLFGMNSGVAMKAMLDMWKEIHPGSAPKAKNFAGNLIGDSDKATIDVWAARHLQRLSGGKRLPALLEAAVPGNWNANATGVTGAYGFAEDVFDRAAAQLGMKPHELQAYTWFLEKEKWATEHWTTDAGEGGSFEQMANALGANRYLAGVSVQQDVPPSDEVVAAAADKILSSVKDDKAVIAYRALPTTGMYANSPERAFDAELTVTPEWKPNKWVSDLASTAKENNQYDVLVSRVVKAGEESANARPGIEIYLRDQRTLDALQPILDEIKARNIDGFTFVVDPRMRMKAAAGQDAGQFAGVRIQYVPEIEMRWNDAFREEVLADPTVIERKVAEKRREMNLLVSKLAAKGGDGVQGAYAFEYDSFVMGKENYDDYIGEAGTAAGGNESRPWFGRSLGENVRAAGQRLQGGQGAAPVGGSVLESGPAPAGAQAAAGGVKQSDLAAALESGEVLVDVVDRDEAGRMKTLRLRKEKK